MEKPHIIKFLADSLFPKQHNNKQEYQKPVSPVSVIPGVGLKIDIDIGDAEKSCDLIDMYKLSDKEILRAKTYYVVDVETTGLNRVQDRIIELAWIYVENGSVMGTYSTLVDPERKISQTASAVNGIFDEDIKGAPKYSDIQGKVKSALVGATVIGHNVTFDLGFIARLIGKTDGRILYIDTYHLARRVFPDLPGYKLGQLCETLHLGSRSSHRALDDVQATLELFNLCQTELQKRDEEAKAERKAKKIEAELQRKALFDGSPLYNVSFAYTGIFASNREELEALAPSVGALIRTKISSRTDYLVAGDVSTLPEWAYQRKMGKAQELIAGGGKIKIITEDEYIEMIGSAKATLSEAKPSVD